MLGFWPRPKFRPGPKFWPPSLSALFPNFRSSCASRSWLFAYAKFADSEQVYRGEGSQNGRKCRGLLNAGGVSLDPPSALPSCAEGLGLGPPDRAAQKLRKVHTILAVELIHG